MLNDEKLQKYYDARWEMMATEGWKDLIEDAQKIFDALNNVLPIQNESELNLKKGQLDILQWLLSLKGSSEQSYENLLSGDISDGS